MNTSRRNIIITGLMLFFTLFEVMNSMKLVMAGVSIVKPDKTTSYNFELDPGLEVTDTIYLINTSNEEIPILLYGADAVSEGSSSFSAKSYTDTQNTVGNWIHFQDTNVTLKPKEELKIDFTMMIPHKTPPGTYAGAVAATTTPGVNDKGMGVVSIQRAILPVYVKVPGEEKFAYEWNDFSLTTKGDHPRFNVLFKNTGNTIVESEGEINVYDATSQALVDTIKITKNQAYGGDNVSISYPFDKSNAIGIYNKYRAVANMTFSRVNIIDNTRSESTNLTKEVSFEINHPEIIWYAVTSLIALIILVVGVIIVKKIQIKKAMPYTVKANETVESIAKNYGIKWKKIAKLNKLKAPYSIKEGQNILLPPSNKKS